MFSFVGLSSFYWLFIVDWPRVQSLDVFSCTFHGWFYLIVHIHMDRSLALPFPFCSSVSKSFPSVCTWVSYSHINLNRNKIQLLLFSYKAAPLQIFPILITCTIMHPVVQGHNVQTFLTFFLHWYLTFG